MAVSDTVNGITVEFPNAVEGQESVSPKETQVPDYSHLAVPDYSHLAPESPDELEAQQSQVMAPATTEVLKHIRDTIPNLYKQIEDVQKDPSPEKVFGIAMQIVGSGVAAGLGKETLNALGSAGGKVVQGTKALPDVEKVAIDLKRAQDDFAKDTQALKLGKEGIDPETTRLKGVLYDRTKDLVSTLNLIKRETKNDISGVTPIAESLKGRVEFFRDQIAETKYKLANKPKMQESPIQQQQSKAGNPNYKLNDIHTQWIKDLTAEDKSPKEIADILTRYYTPPGVLVSTEQVLARMRDLGIAPKMAGDIWTDTMTDRLVAYSKELMGKRPMLADITRQMVKDFPTLKGHEGYISERLSRNRKIEQFRETPKKASDKLQENTGLENQTISRHPDQGEFNLFTPTKDNSVGAARTPPEDVHYRPSSTVTPRSASTIDFARGRENEVQLLKSRDRQITYDSRTSGNAIPPILAYERRQIKNRLKELKDGNK